MKKRWPVKQKISVFLLTHLLITITLLVNVSSFYYPNKYQAKQKHLSS